MREQLLDRDVLPRTLAELRQVLHRTVGKLQLATIHQDHHGKGDGERFGDGTEQEHRVRRRFSKDLLRHLIAPPHMQHGCVECAVVDLGLDDLGGGLHGGSSGSGADGQAQSGKRESEGVAAVHEVQRLSSFITASVIALMPTAIEGAASGR